MDENLPPKESYFLKGGWLRIVRIIEGTHRIRGRTPDFRSYRSGSAFSQVDSHMVTLCKPLNLFGTSLSSFVK